jgi:hypothetical protein
LLKNTTAYLIITLKKSIKQSKKKNNKSQGLQVTFMSKYFINDKIVKPIVYSIKNNIVKETLVCKYFSIMIDNTQASWINFQFASVIL